MFVSECEMEHCVGRMVMFVFELFEFLSTVIEMCDGWSCVGEESCVWS